MLGTYVMNPYVMNPTCKTILHSPLVFLNLRLLTKCTVPQHAGGT